ncbi:MAG: hypothetical protein ABSG43_24750 [Solirubrobacteraceae bacterium]|jgi:hypothetical protein
MSAPDRNCVYGQAAATASLVERIAGRVRSIADTINAGALGFADLPAAGDAFALLARGAADAIDCCLVLASGRGDAGAGAFLASGEYDLAVGWIAALGDTLDAAVAVYAQACGGLADRLALAEQHLPTAASADGRRFSAALIACHARAVAQATVSR